MLQLCASKRIYAGNRCSYAKVAVDADLDRSYIGGIERGEHNLTLINLSKIVNALDLKQSELLTKATY